MWSYRSEWVGDKLVKVLAHSSVTKLAPRALKELLELINKKNETFLESGTTLGEISNPNNNKMQIVKST